MIRFAAVFTVILHATTFTPVHTAKQQLRLSDSYLPVAMQIIAHLTDQMSYDTKPSPAKPTQPQPAKPAQPAEPTKPAQPAQPTQPQPAKPVQDWVYKPTTKKPLYVTSKPTTGWWMTYTPGRTENTTPYHKPGIYAPVAPPSPGERIIIKDPSFLLPLNQNYQYTVIEPVEKRTEEPLLSIEHMEIKPLVEPKPQEELLLPPSFDQLARTGVEKFVIDDEEVTDEDLQYLSPDVREMIKLAHNPLDERLMEEVRAGPVQEGKVKLSATNLRLQLIYDLMSREAKKQKLSDYTGFSDAVLNELTDSASGGARAQLSLALSRMIERKDCSHDYVNNRAREMIAELGNDASGMSTEIRYLEPLVYKF